MTTFPRGLGNRSKGDRSARQSISFPSHDVNNDGLSSNSSSAERLSSLPFEYGSLDRKNLRNGTTEKKIGGTNTKSKLVSQIEKPNVPPPSVPISGTSTRPTSFVERPSVPPPERPHRSCDLPYKMKQKSLENLYDNDIENNELSFNQSFDNETENYPHQENINTTFDNHTSDNSDTLELNSNKEFCYSDKDSIGFVDDSDEDGLNDFTKKDYRIRSKYPRKPKRVSSPQSSDETNQLPNELSLKSEYNKNTELPTEPLSPTKMRPPRPQPPAFKPRLGSNENTHL